MSRCLTLEEYLQEFVDDNTQPGAEDVRLVVTDQQAQTLGYFLINGLAGFVECVRLQRGSGLEVEQSETQGGLPQDDEHAEEFIN